MTTAETAGPEALRSEHGLRPLTEDEEGTGVDRLANGVYGFTYSPFEENFPVFSQRKLNTFEAHKLSNGSTWVVGYVTEDQAASIEAAKEPVSARLHPEPGEEASTMVVIPVERVVSHVTNSQRGGTGVEVKIGPLS